MLAYAPSQERHRCSPSVLALIAGAHAVAIVAVMTARMNLPPRVTEPPIHIESIPVEPAPKPNPPEPRTENGPSNRPIDSPEPIVNSLPKPGPEIVPLPMPLPNPGTGIGDGIGPAPIPRPVIQRTGPRFITPDHALRPPYPEEKRRLEQEANLRLRLSIDERGRVIAVEPVGRADPVFLEAARRHILKSWRYTPASEAGNAIASSTVITLKFELDED